MIERMKIVAWNKFCLLASDVFWTPSFYVGSFSEEHLATLNSGRRLIVAIIPERQDERGRQQQLKITERFQNHDQFAFLAWYDRA